MDMELSRFTWSRRAWMRANMSLFATGRIERVLDAVVAVRHDVVAGSDGWVE